MSIFTSVGGVRREVPELYAGAAGVTRQVAEGYAGVGGVLRQVYALSKFADFGPIMNDVVDFDVRYETATSGTSYAVNPDDKFLVGETTAKNNRKLLGGIFAIRTRSSEYPGLACPFVIGDTGTKQIYRDGKLIFEYELPTVEVYQNNGKPFHYARILAYNRTGQDFSTLWDGRYFHLLLYGEKLS